MRLGHVPALTGLRGLAIAAVVIYHAGWLPGGFLGVDLFFVLSGFLITTLLLEEHHEHGGVSFRRFYGRRARRLLPVAMAAIFFVELVMVPALGGLHGQALAGVYSALYVENFAHLLRPPVVSYLGHFWSLSQEEQFYLLWPPLLVVLLRRRVRAEWLVAGLVLAAVTVMAHRALLSGDWWRFYYAPDTRADGLAIGCALAVAYGNGWIRSSRAWQPFAFAALAVFVGETLLLGKTRGVGLYGISVANLAAATVIAAVVSSSGGAATTMLAWRPLTFLGLISYSLYVWQPVVATSTLTKGALMIAIAVPVAWLSYRYIEQPFRHQMTPTKERCSPPSGPIPPPLLPLTNGIDGSSIDGVPPPDRKDTRGMFGLPGGSGLPDPPISGPATR